MANRLLRLTVHDPGIIKALDALRKNRKQSAFVVEALRHFLRTAEGKEQLASFLALERNDAAEIEPKSPPEKKEPPPSAPGSKANLDDIFNV